MSVGVAAEIKSKLDLVEIVGESVSLRKAGTTFKGLCPFHGEKTPSFTVTPARESWKCFGCGKGGDLFSFVMERDGIDFPEVLRRLAARAGVELDERSSREDARRKRLREVLEQAIAFYHQVLTGTKHGQAALEYLHGRGFTDATIETHQLGWSLEAWDELSTRLVTKRGVREDELIDTGIAKRSQRRRGVYDTFRGRIIFPIRDANGNPTGLGGRILGAERNTPDGRGTGPKYLHTSATQLFDKSRTLYLIDKAKGAIRKTGRAVIVEGNTDALMAHQAGFENVVCSLGTALTPGHIELVTRYAPEIALAYDVDAAGQSAATFGATELSALVSEIERSPHRGRLTEVGVVRLPAGKDPDEVMRDEPETWRKAADEPQPIMEYLIDRYAQRHDARTIQGRERLVNAVIPTLRTIGDPVRRDGYLQLLARRSGVDERVLLESLRRTDAPLGGIQRPGAGVQSGGPGDHGGRRIDLDALLSVPGALDPEAVRRMLEPVESTLLRLILVHPERQERIRTRLRPEELITTPARELWRAILAHRGPDGERPFERKPFLDSLDPTVGAIARTLYARTDPLPDTDEGLDGALADCMLLLRRRKLDELFEYKRAELVEAEAADDEATTDRIRREIAALRQERADVDILKNENSLLHRRPRPETPPTPTHAGGLA
ncbi:MAG: DNA primase [Chloroflexi bacterium]|nr:DNA primase [Chloroflexota bacterium]